MRQGVKWTNLSRRKISRKLKELGTPASKNIVSHLLRESGYRRRKPQKNEPWARMLIAILNLKILPDYEKSTLIRGKPVISVDTKKKELLGNFYREGVVDSMDPVLVNDHNFPSASDGKVIPHGIYDLRKNTASLHLNTSHDTTELACESIELWWIKQGRFDYPNQKELLILCDGGGSNSALTYIFNEDLQALSNRLGLEIRIAHYPPYCSKYNPIEHRLFPHVTRACKGVSLESLETAVHYMSKTETTTGLSVTVRIIDKVFQTGRKYAADFKKKMTIKFDELLPKWNYRGCP